jgi:hypothetical protein
MAAPYSGVGGWLRVCQRAGKRLGAFSLDNVTIARALIGRAPGYRHAPQNPHNLQNLTRRPVLWVLWVLWRVAEG